jgi:predicted metalloendopeptidase
MHDAEPYLAMDAHAVEVREKFVVFLSKMLDLFDSSDSLKRAREILGFETAIARVVRTTQGRYDGGRPAERLARDQLSAAAPGFDWVAYLDSNGIDVETPVLIRRPDVIRGVARVIDETDLRILKDHLAFSLICTWAWAGALPQSIFDLQFDFYGRTRRGATQQPDRWTRAYRFLNRTVGEDLGAVYASRHVPAAARTPRREGPEIRRDDVYGNAERAHFWNWRRELARLDHAVEAREWPLDPVELEIELVRRGAPPASRIELGGTR